MPRPFLKTVILTTLLLATLLLTPWTINNLTWLRAILRAAPLPTTSPYSTYLAGRAAAAAGDWETAAHALAKPILGRETLRRAAYISALGHTSDWRKTLPMLDWNDPNDVALWVRLIFDHRQEMDPAERSAFETTIATRPDFLGQYANLLLGASEYAQAERVLLSLPPQQRSPTAQITLGRAYFYQAKLDEAESVFGTLYAATPTAEAAFWLGRTRFNQGQQKPGLADMEWAVANAKGIFHPQYLLYLISAQIQAGECAAARLRLDEAKPLLYTSSDQTTLTTLESRWAAACSTPKKR